MPSCLSPCCQFKTKGKARLFLPVMLLIQLNSFRASCRVLKMSAVEISPIYLNIKSTVMSRSKNRDLIMQEDPWIFFLRSTQLHHITVQKETRIKREARGCDRPGRKH